MMRCKLFNKWAIFLLLAALLPFNLSAQYFGRNKPSYRNFDFKVFQSPNFDIHHYFEDEEVARRLAKSFEKWYHRHSVLFDDTFELQNPILIYANHPDFQQTTAISGQIGIGTQGVTEALRNRVVIPVLETNAQTDHVIGHELVHVFHFRALFNHDSLSLNSLRNLPLWLVEGMAEYFSIGSVDAHTAMIMRDAIQQDDFPDLREMSRNYKYNPYRFGHGFVSFFGRTWGDSLIVPLYKETAKFGYERALERVIGLSAATVSDIWKSAYASYYGPLMADTTRHEVPGERLIHEGNAGRINISPSLSPDGRFMAFFSERDLVSIDLFLADAQTGRIIRKLNSSIRSNDIDGFNFFESVGSWSPDGRRFVYIAEKKGASHLMIVDVERPRRTREIRIPGVPYVNNPSWSPDGRYIAFNGLSGGIPNLYLFDMESSSVTRLTDDLYSYIHANWSPDGQYLVFATDRPQTSQVHRQESFHFNIATMHMGSANRELRVYDIFPDAENLNPQFRPDGRAIYFLSNRDGYRNLYLFEPESGDVRQLTDFYTGISGITHLSPAFSVARNTGQVVFTHYQKGSYSIFSASPDAFLNLQADPNHIDMAAATLPPLNRPTLPLVDNKLQYDFSWPQSPPEAFNAIPYRAQFELTFIGNSGIGVGASRFGTGVSGGVSMLFSDITGDNQLFSALAVNGEIYDFGGQVGYLNQKRRIAWGGMVSHIPYPFSRLRLIPDLVEIGGELVLVENLQLLLQRTFEDQISAFAYYPISTTRRIEMGASLAWYYFRIDALNNYYWQGLAIGQSRERLEAPRGFNLQRLNMAYVGDNSIFGMASPITGYRYRFGAEKYFGRIDMFSVTADYRQYLNARPFTFAFRAVHNGRYGRQANNDLFYPLYLGYPGWVRGFSYNTLYRLEDALDEKFTLDQLLGTRILMGGIELRVPFTGPERLALITSNFLFTELAWFVDAGVAWDEGMRITLDKDNAYDPGRRYPVISMRPSIRVNLFGALILEPFYAWPLHTKGFGKGVWGLNFVPGW